MDIRCYSQRMLNPFHGVMDIIALDAGDAVTTDGKTWVLYIHDNFDSCDDEPEEFSCIDMPDIRFGTWSREAGLQRAPLIGSYHYTEIQCIGVMLLDALHKHADDVPFLFDDHYELWLLDEKTQEPLALLDSVCNAHDMHRPESLTWNIGNRCRKSFTSESLQIEPEEETHACKINRLINARAGSKPSAQWFHRQVNGNGIGMLGAYLEYQYYGRELCADLFPIFFVDQCWRKLEHSNLINDYILWQSSWFLLLHSLNDEQRASLEIAARKQAYLVEELYPLYPKIINKKHIKAARVEVALRNSNAAPAKEHTYTGDMPIYLEV